MNTLLNTPLHSYCTHSIVLDQLLTVLGIIVKWFKNYLIAIICMCSAAVLFSPSGNSQSFSLENRFKNEVIVRSGHDPSYDKLRQHYLQSIDDIRRGGGVIIVSSFMFLVSRVIAAKGEGLYGNDENNGYAVAGRAFRLLSVVSVVLGSLRYKEGIRAKKNIVHAYFAPGLGSVYKDQDALTATLSIEDVGLTFKLNF